MIQRSKGHQLPGASPQVEGAKYVCMHVMNVECVCVRTCINAECVYEPSVNSVFAPFVNVSMCACVDKSGKLGNQPLFNGC